MTKQHVREDSGVIDLFAIQRDTKERTRADAKAASGPPPAFVRDAPSDKALIAQTRGRGWSAKLGRKGRAVAAGALLLLGVGVIVAAGSGSEPSVRAPVDGVRAVAAQEPAPPPAAPVVAQPAPRPIETAAAPAVVQTATVRKAAKHVAKAPVRPPTRVKMVKVRSSGTGG